MLGNNFMSAQIRTFGVDKSLEVGFIIGSTINLCH